MNVVQTFNVLASLASVVCMLYSSYFAFIALYSFRKLKPLPATRHFNRFKILIAARNEEQVIGHLVDSLQQQNYPQENFEILVISNNCTDNTQDVALAHGARVFNCQRSIRSKGDALAEVIDSLVSDETFDAYCIFDADNLVHPDFLAEMNKALEAGKQVAQGYRDSKNPVDSAIASSYSIYYWMIDRFYNRAREAFGFSAMIGGSGFMVSRHLMNQFGGWNTKTITEDLEMTIACAMVGAKVAYVQDAVFFDEQPLNFHQSWSQRKRWSTGIWHCLSIFAADLFRQVVSKKDRIALDLLLLLLNPVISIIYLMSFTLFIILQTVNVHLDIFLYRRFYLLIFESFDFSYFLTTGLALLTVVLEHKKQRGIFKGIAYFWVFLISWMVIQLISLVKPSKKWQMTVHSRAVSLK